MICLKGMIGESHCGQFDEFYLIKSYHMGRDEYGAALKIILLKLEVQRRGERVAMLLAAALTRILMQMPSFTTERFEHAVLLSLFYLTFRELFKHQD